MSMPSLTADDLYEMAQQLPSSERLRLVEKIAHSLALTREPAKPEGRRPDGAGALPPPWLQQGPLSGARARTLLVGQVTEIAVDPLRFTIRGSRGDVSISAGMELTETVWSAWGHEVIADVEAFLDIDGQTIDAVAISLEVSAQADDLLSNFESTFGSGSEVWCTADARRELAVMRGDGP